MVLGDRDHLRGRHRAGRLAGPRGNGFYSFDLGTWHLVTLNSECYFRAGCAQEQGTVAARGSRRHTGPVGSPYWHRPRFTSGHHGATHLSWTDRVWTIVRQVAHGHRPSSPKNEGLTMDPLWKIVSENKVEVVLNGHDHDYERFAPMDANGQPDPNGVREFVVGTDGNGVPGVHHAAAQERNPGRDAGVLLLTLKPNGYICYIWGMQPIAGRIAIDSGSGDAD